MFHCTLVTPIEEVFKDEVEAVTLPGTDGMFTVLAHHTHIVATLKPGTMRIYTRDQEDERSEQTFAIERGVAEMSRENRLTVFTGRADTGESNVR